MSGYKYEFSGMSAGLTQVNRTDYRKGTNKSFRVALKDEEVLHSAGRFVNSLMADLMDIGGAVLVADRFSPRLQGQTTIKLVLPIRHPEVFQRKEVLEELHSTLHYFTNDQWVFEFIQHDGVKRISERQHRFFARSEDEKNVHVALFSGGADALGGLAHQLIDNPSAFFSLVTIGTNNHQMKSVQTKLVNELCRSTYRKNLHHIFIETPREYYEEIPTNSDFRVRAFVFLLIGSAFAILEGQNRLYVYENGIGAINLPFQASEVGLDHSRTVHPMSLNLVSKLVSEVVQIDFRIDNPFFLRTKAEVCSGLQRANLQHLFKHSVSCDRIRGSYQCGNCSSCILRRIAAFVLRLEDAPYTLKRNGTHLRHMARQIEYLQQSLDTENPWYVLAKKYPTPILDIDVARPFLMPHLTEATLHEGIIELYERYEQEWQRAIPYFSQNEMTIGIDPSFIA